MILNIHSGASYLLAGKGRSRAGAYIFFGSLPGNSEPIWLNGNIHIMCAILKRVAASFADVELGALFLNGQEAKIKIIRLIFGRNGTPATSNTDPCGQYYHHWHQEQHDQTPPVARNGDAIFMPSQPGSSENVGHKPTSRGRTYVPLPQQSTYCSSLQTFAPILFDYGKKNGLDTGAQPNFTMRVC